MGVMLSVLLSYMGAIELVFIVRDVTHQLALHQMRLRNEKKKDNEINVVQSQIKASIDALDTVETVKIMQDGVLYEHGYRINTDHSVEAIAQQWNDRRKSMCTDDLSTSSTSKESEQKSTVDNESTKVITNQNERTKDINSNEYDRAIENVDSLNDSETCEHNNYRPIVRDDRTGRKKAFKKRHSSSSQSSDSIRLSREEELKMFTSLEEQECNNSRFSPISYANVSNESVVKTSDNTRNESSFQEKQRYDDYGKEDDPWGNAKPSNFDNSELWRRESATSIVEERDEENYSTTKRLTSDKQNSRGFMRTADKSTRKTSCKNDPNASDLVACLPIDRDDNREACSLLTLNDEHASMELIDKNEEPLTGEMIKKIDKQENLIQYFSDASDSESNKLGEDQTHATFIDVNKSRDIRSCTVYSRSDSETSNIYHQSISTDSSSTFNEPSVDSDYNTRTYSRINSNNSFIQDEIDSEEYHHNHRFSMTDETLEYIRGRDDWRLHIEQTFNGLYRRQSSSISVREEIDSDEYHHDRQLTDIIEMAYLDANNTQSLQSLPSSFDENKVFERYYIELEQIKDHLSNDIQQDIAKKQVVLLDSNEIQTTEGYLYPLPDIVLDQIDDHDKELYTINIQSDSEYGNVTSESEDDMQSVVDVMLDRDNKYESEIIATLDVDSNDSEMIEVTLWDLKDDLNKDVSSRESSVDILDIPIEDASNKQPYDDGDFEYVDLRADENLVTLDSAKNSEELTGITNDLKVTDYGSENIDQSNAFENIMVENYFQNVSAVESNSKEEAPLSNSQSQQSSLKLINETGSLQKLDQSMSQLFIEHEKASPTLQSTSTKTAPVAVSKMKQKKAPYENVDDLVKEGCMGLWFHN